MFYRGFPCFVMIIRIAVTAFIFKTVLSPPSGLLSRQTYWATLFNYDDEDDLNDKFPSYYLHSMIKIFVIMVFTAVGHVVHSDLKHLQKFFL